MIKHTIKFNPVAIKKSRYPPYDTYRIYSDYVRVWFARHSAEEAMVKMYFVSENLYFPKLKYKTTCEVEKHIFDGKLFPNADIEDFRFYLDTHGITHI